MQNNKARDIFSKGIHFWQFITRDSQANDMVRGYGANTLNGAPGWSEERLGPTCAYKALHHTAHSFRVHDYHLSRTFGIFLTTASFVHS